MRSGDRYGGLAGVDGVLLGTLVLKVDNAVIGLYFFNTLHTFLFIYYEILQKWQKAPIATELPVFKKTLQYIKSFEIYNKNMFPENNCQSELMED